MRCAVSYNCIFVIGPTAVGKTAIGVRLAAALGGEVISADSRQVYSGLDIGSGKDLKDYELSLDLVAKLNPSLAESLSSGSVSAESYHVPYHLIDVCDLSHEYNLFDFQEGFYKAFADISARGKIPVVVGGTGMYLDSILRNYDMIPMPENPELYEELNQKSYDELKEILIREKEKLHNTSEFGDKERLIKAIMINRYNESPECKAFRAKMAPRPQILPLVIGTTLDRNLVRSRIESRLKARFDEGLIEEVENLHRDGADWARLEALGLEYRFVSEYLQQKIESKEKLFELLNIAIRQFAKRQETWFRGMEKKGVQIHWLPEIMDVESRFDAALAMCKELL